ncbi:periplasmic or secreted lipoprotein [Candidatus Scalindua japonica]|uniref:Periplasmic or secreted lipoprotein n=1 Tax=Candidatus Scalindua japonica TaxID=1284222 RepID=A0A286TYC7_9BACT|nr:periplasmic or secreted lipoprotein [Candidatus Scalindua japonica]
MKKELPIIKPKKVIKAILKANFYIHHQTGSHVQLRHIIKTNLRVTIPRHDRFDMPRHVLKSILRQAELSVDEFLELL